MLGASVLNSDRLIECTDGATRKDREFTFFFTQIMREIGMGIGFVDE